MYKVYVIKYLLVSHYHYNVPLSLDRSKSILSHFFVLQNLPMAVLWILDVSSVR